MSTRSFARDTQVERRAAGDFVAVVGPDWDIGGKTNGGYLLALIARAMAEESGRPDPVTLTGHFLRPVAAGPVDLAVQVVKEGKRFAVANATLVSDGKPALQVLGAFGDLGQAQDNVERIDAAPPDLPPPEECVAHTYGRSIPAMFGNLDMRLHPDDSGFKKGSPSGQPCVRGWFRFATDEVIDSVALLFVVDAFPPTAFNAHLPVSWTPTVELTAHVRARPAPGWLRASFRTRFVSGGFLEEDGEIWDSTGRMVAQSRQLALVPRQRS